VKIEVRIDPLTREFHFTRMYVGKKHVGWLLTLLGYIETHFRLDDSLAQSPGHALFLYDLRANADGDVEVRRHARSSSPQWNAVVDELIHRAVASSGRVLSLNDDKAPRFALAILFSTDPRTYRSAVLDFLSEAANVQTTKDGRALEFLANPFVLLGKLFQ